jgi:NADH:ubiquinone oxidoreductase subunit H
MDTSLIIEWVVKSLIMIFALLTGFAYLTFYERKALGPHPGAHRPQPGRPLGAAPAGGRRGQADL